MCGPAAIPIALSLASAAVGVASTYQTAKFERQQLRQNAQLAEQAALDASRRGAIEEEQHRNRVRAMLGAQRAAFGANNVVSSSGSPSGILAQTAQFGEADALTIANNAAREAFGYRVEASNARNRAAQVNRAANLKMTSTVLTSASNAYGFWRQGG